MSETEFLDEKAEYCLASSVDTPPTVLHELAKSLGTGVALAVASNPNSSSSTLRFFLGYGVRFRAALAANPSSPADVLQELSKHDEFHDLLSQNPSTPSETLWRMVKGKQSYSSSLGYFVAQNPNLDSRTAQLLLTTNHDDVKYSLARNPATPIDILKELELLECPDFSACCNPRTDPEVLNQLWNRFRAFRPRLAIAQNPQCSEALLCRVMSSTNADLRLAAYKNDSLPLRLKALSVLDDEIPMSTTEHITDDARIFTLYRHCGSPVITTREQRMAVIKFLQELDAVPLSVYELIFTVAGSRKPFSCTTLRQMWNEHLSTDVDLFLIMSVSGFLE